MTELKNFSGEVTPSIIDTEYRRCNFKQPAPVNDGGVMKGIRIFPGDDTPRTFIDCAMGNCEPPPGSTLVHCNTTIAEHRVVTSTDQVTVDGETIILEHHSRIIYGRYRDGAYMYFASPKVVEVD